MSSSDPHDLKVQAPQLAREADQVRQSEDERTRGLIRASAEYAGAERRSSHLSQADLNAVVAAAEENLRQARNKQSPGEGLAGIERRKHGSWPKD
jgi:hypothetical protein